MSGAQLSERCVHASPSPHTAPPALHNVLKTPTKGKKPEKIPELESGMLLIDSDDEVDKN